MLRTHQATRYVVPLREGGSLPAVVDTEDGGLFVVKFRGAGQGSRALLAEILVAELARAVGLPVPEVALVELDESFARSERDPEIRDILFGSIGVNVGLRYLEGALNFDPAADSVAPDLAARIVWLDALVSNIDRTARNPNLMWWQDSVWLIDHGAALYFHHDWESVDQARAVTAFPPIRDHVLLHMAESIDAADEHLIGALPFEALCAATAALPDELLMDAPPGTAAPFDSPAANRDAYLDYLAARLACPRAFAHQAETARGESRTAPRARQPYRR
jgi:hypothetical protein